MSVDELPNLLLYTHHGRVHAVVTWVRVSVSAVRPFLTILQLYDAITITIPYFRLPSKPCLSDSVRRCDSRAAPLGCQQSSGRSTNHQDALPLVGPNTSARLSLQRKQPSEAERIARRRAGWVLFGCAS